MILHRVAGLASLFVLWSASVVVAASDAAVPLAVAQGRCEAVIETPHADDQWLLIVGALSQASGPFPVHIHAEPTRAAPLLPEDQSVPAAGWKDHVRDLAERQAAARKRRSVEIGVVPLRQPPARRIFHLFTGDQDFRNERDYVAVTAELRGVGKHCQVYVDRDDPAAAALGAAIADAIRTFDEEVVPRFAAWGRALDVDRDGRFTLLFSHWLGKLQNGKVAVSGFVRGGDFLRELAAPFGNQCDVLYLNSNLKPGPFLRTILVHEYVHAIVFSEHIFGDFLPRAERQDEESWLNEGLAHLAEESQGHTWGNLDYRVSAFLNQPQRFGLVVPDYYGRGVWRSPGPRGAAFLFLRWCREQYGPELPARLIQSNLHGLTNLETATQRRFADLFRAWCVSLATERLGPAWKQPPGFRYLSCGPRTHSLTMADGVETVELAGTAAAYIRLHSPDGRRTRLTITGPADAQLQVTLVRRPRQPLLSMRCLVDRRLQTVRLEATATHGDLVLENAVWEWLTPTGVPSVDTSWQQSDNVRLTLHDRFAEPRLRAGTSAQPRHRVAEQR